MKQIPPSGFPYKWCSDSGEDEFGIWLEFRIEEASQRMRWIIPGKFSMGSPYDEPHRHYSESRHDVTLTKGFWIADSTCPQDLWQAVVQTNTSNIKGKGRPVENVSWHDCSDFLSRINGMISDFSLALPTEAQWEYACRAGTNTPFSFGITVTPEQVNYNGEQPYLGDKKELNRAETVEIRSLPPNPWGLFEMHGNVWEWCNDWYAEYETGNAVDPVGSPQGTYRVLRGGSAYSGAADCRSAARSRCHSEGRYSRNGFRFVWNPWNLNEKDENVHEERDDFPGEEADTARSDDYVIIPRKEELTTRNSTPHTTSDNPEACLKFP